MKINSDFCISIGHQLTVFNSQSTIQVGGRWNRSKGRVERPFLGVIAGLVVNGAKVLELAAAKDGKVITRGDVQLMPAGNLIDRAAPLQRMQQVNLLIIKRRVFNCIFRKASHSFFTQSTISFRKGQDTFPRITY
jgi:leucine-rich repeat transmembrane neuronal protein 1/2